MEINDSLFIKHLFHYNLKDKNDCPVFWIAIPFIPQNLTVPVPV